jgi:ribosomal protein S18 acetylase RimI-like enzyme
MHSADLAEVAAVDQASFAPLWHQTRSELEQALDQAAYATVAVMENAIIGYQISTSTPFHAHLARLAVHPDLQRLSIGYGIVRELLETFTRRGITNITVNTQNDNYSSQKLYEKLGFYRTGEAFPVYSLSAR